MKRVRSRNAGRRGRLVASLALVAVVALMQVPATAESKLPELPLPSATPLLDHLIDQILAPVTDPVSDPVSDTLDNVTGLLGGATEEAGLGLGGGQQNPGTVQPKTPAVVPVQPSRTGSWSVDRPPASAEIGAPGVRVGNSRSHPPMSYGAAVTDGFARTARRAATLAGPVAAPMILALFAVGLLYVAVGGPGRLVKVEEERKAFRERRTFRI